MTWHDIQPFLFTEIKLKHWVCNDWNTHTSTLSNTCQTSSLQCDVCLDLPRNLPVCYVQLGPATMTKLSTPVYSVSGHFWESAECTASSSGNIWIWIRPIRGVQGQDKVAAPLYIKMRYRTYSYYVFYIILHYIAFFWLYSVYKNKNKKIG